MQIQVEQEMKLDRGLWFGKMSLGHLAPMTEKILEQSCKKQSGSLPKKPPLFLYLKTDGQQVGAVPEWEMAESPFPLPGVYLMHSFGESPNAVVESHLSRILEGLPLPKYYLSEKACQGILNRAERRGKPLPPMLKDALNEMIEWHRQGGIPSSLIFCSENQPAICIQGNCIDRADTAGCNGKGWTEDVSYTLNTVDRPAVSQAAGFKYRPSAKAHGIGYAEDQAPTLTAVQLDASVVVPLENHPNDCRVKISEDGIVQTLSRHMGTGGGNTPMVLKSIGFNGEAGTVEDSGMQTMAQNAYDKWVESDIGATLRATGGCYQGGSESVVINEADRHHIVRRLTPLECERLQGYPDGWTNIGKWTDTKGKIHKESADSARYKALGNSIAIPPWTYVLQKLSLCCGADHTMASLFDGIGGFPLIWEMLNGEGTCLWASEIDEFPIAVTKRHFNKEV